jgi:RNA polymerase sigma-70 factor (ECF subfamily)
MLDSTRHEEFVGLLSESRHQLFAYIYAIVRNVSDAEDLYQQTSLVLWKKFGEYESGTHFVRWACAVARFEIRNYQVSRRRRREYLSEEVQVELANVYARVGTEYWDARREALASCLERLPASDRRLVDLCYAGNDQIKDVAARLNRTARNVYRALARIRRSLNDCVVRNLARERS